METRDIQILLQAFNATDLTRMAYSKDGFNLVLERQNGQAIASEAPVAAMPQMVSQPNPVVEMISVPNRVPAPATPSHAPAVTAAAPSPSPAEVPVSPADLVKAPLVGVFFAAPAPDAAPFVTIGQKISKGQTLCIVEAMKVMNEIQAEWDGVVEQILAKSEDIVEYGQPLFSVRRLG